MNLERLSRLAADAAAAASLALARLTRHPAEVRLTRVELLQGTRGHPIFESRQPMSGIYLHIAGGLSGTALLCFSEKTADALVKRLAGDAGRATDRAMAQSVLKETGNIVVSNYVGVLANELGERVVPGLPHLASGSFGPMLDLAIRRAADGAPEGLLIEVEIVLDGEAALGELFLLLSTNQLSDPV